MNSVFVVISCATVFVVGGLTVALAFVVSQLGSVMEVRKVPALFAVYLPMYLQIPEGAISCDVGVPQITKVFDTDVKYSQKHKQCPHIFVFHANLVAGRSYYNALFTKL